MASPSVFSQTPTTSSGVLDTSHPVTIPTHAAGDMILVDAIFDGNPDVTIDSGSSSTGWSIDWNVKNTTGGTTPTSVGLSLLATGSSHTLTLTSSAGEASEITVRVVRKAGSGTLNVFAATPTNGSSSNGTPPAISPGAGTQDFLFLLSIGQDGVQHASAAPSGYSNFVATVNGTSSRVDLATCEKAATGVTGDTPGAFTSSPEQWICGGWAVWETAGGGDITGTLAATESGADTLAAAGDVLVDGALAATESGADTFAATGGVLVAGTLAAIESGADAFAATGDVLVQGTLAATETGSDTFAATGGAVTAITGDLAATESGADTFAASGDIIVQGLLSASESGADTFAASGDIIVQGLMTATEADPDVFAAVGAILVQGAMAATETGSDSFVGIGDGIEPANGMFWPLVRRRRR